MKYKLHKPTKQKIIEHVLKINFPSKIAKEITYTYILYTYLYIKTKLCIFNDSNHVICMTSTLMNVVQ